MWMILSILALALALAADAFAVAVAEGAAGRGGSGHAVKLGLAFGSAQGLMPAIGGFLGITFIALVSEVDHWIALVLLSLLGFRMIREAARGAPVASRLPLAGMGLLAAAAATSIDALAAGITLPAAGIPILTACLAIALVTGVLSAAGVAIGAVAGRWIGRWSEAAGGIILVLLGLKIFIQHHFFGA